MGLKAGETGILTATVLPENAFDKTLIWSSNDSNVAAVENGKVKALAVGTAAITAKSADGKVTAQCTVTVEKSPYALGDINADHEINAVDALQALRHSVSEITLTGDAFTRGDVYKDDKVDATDALQILRYSVKEITAF